MKKCQKVVSFIISNISYEKNNSLRKGGLFDVEIQIQRPPRREGL